MRPRPDEVPVTTTSFLVPNFFETSMLSRTLVSDGIFQLDMPLNPCTAVVAHASTASQRAAIVLFWI